MFLVPLDRRRGLIYGLLALAEAAWLTTLSYTFIQPLTPLPLWFLSALTFIVLALLLGWLTDIYGLPFEFSRIVGVGLALVGLLTFIYQAVYATATTLPTESWLRQFGRALIIEPNPGQTTIFVLCLLTTIYIWWRYLPLGFNPPETSALSETLRLGALGFIAAYLGSSTGYFTTPNSNLLFLFISCLLFGFSLIYSQLVDHHHGRGASGNVGVRLLNGGGIWLLFMLIALLLISIFTTATVTTLFQWIFSALYFILTPVIYALIWLVNLLMPWLEALFDWLQSLIGEVEVEVPPAESGGERPDDLEPTAPPRPPEWLKYVGWGSRSLLILAILLLLYWLVSRLAPRRERALVKEADQVSTSVAVDDGGLGGLWSTAKDRLANLLGMVRRFGLGPDLRAAMAIRRIYAALIGLAEQHQLTRAPSQTPTEFLGPLSEAWPNLATQFGLITTAYIQVHYGELPEGETSLAEVRQAWEVVYDTIEAQPTKPNR